VLHRKPPRRVVKLHRGDAQVGDNEINARQFRRGEDLGEAGEIGAVGRERIRAEAEEAETGLGLWQFDGIGIEAKQASARLNVSQQFLRMAAVTESAIDADFARSRSEDFEDFRQHDRPVRTGGRLAASEDFLDRIGIPGGIVLLVFLLEAARVLAGVTRAAAMRPGRAFGHRDGCGVVGHSSQQALVSDMAKTRCPNAKPTASKG